MNKDLKMKRRKMLEMGKEGACIEKAPASSTCVICNATPVLYRVGWLGYCKAHKAEATINQTNQHLHRQVRNETNYDLVEYKYKLAAKKQRNTLKVKRAH